MVVIGVDIDQTIAWGGIKGDLVTNIDYYRRLGVHLPSTIADFPALLQHPHVIPLHQTIPGAVEGLVHLSQIGCIGYYTVRKHEDAGQQKLIEEATRQWLAAKQFPKPNATVFCRSILAKVIALYEQEKTSQEPLVLIDDHWQRVVQDFDRVFSEDDEVNQTMKQRLVLVAYGTDTLPAITNGIRVVPLPSWLHIADIDMVFRP